MKIFVQNLQQFSLCLTFLEIKRVRNLVTSKTYSKTRQVISYISLYFCGAATQRGSWPPRS